MEGLGEYQIEVTNVVDTRTFKERQIVPSLMSMANMQKIEANRCKRMMLLQAKASKPVGDRRKTTKSIGNVLPNRKEEGLRLLARIFKRHIRRSFD